MQKTAYGHSSAWWRQRWLNKTLLVMKLTFVLLTVGLLQVHASGFSQSITLSAKDMPVQKLFKAIEEQTGYSVTGDKSLLKNAKRVSIDVKNMELQEFLKIVLQDQPFRYEISENTIIISEKLINRGFEPTAPSPHLNNAPPITGIIRDADGNPLQGVNVVVKGTKRGITTDAQGKFSIDAKENDILVISSIGYNIKEVKITSLNVPHIIALDKSVSQLDEVQYIAYGTTSKRFNTSNTTTVTAADIEKQPVNNPLLALQGRVPGMTIMQANGVPGGGITVRIQGRNNLDPRLVGSDPFYVIDGVPYASQNLNTFSGGSPNAPILGSSSNDGVLRASGNYGSPLAFINVADIESIAILKDADATAIYGSRAANGAILITTKKGRSGALKTDINLQQGWGQVPRKMDLLNTQQYMEMRWEGKRNDGRPVNTTDYDLRGVWDTTRYTDWQEELIGGTANFTRLNAGVSGGTNNIQYLLNSSYGKETSVFPGNFANTSGSLHFNLSVSSINQRLKLQMGGSYLVGKNLLPAEDYTSYALNLPPVAPSLYNNDGSLNWAPDPETGNSTWFNPLGKEYYIFESKTNNLISNGSISYRIIPGLELKSTFGFTSITTDQFISALDQSEKPELRADRIRAATFSFNTSRSWIVEPQLTFQQHLGRHNFSMLLGSTFQSQNNIGRGVTAGGHNSDLLLRDMLAGQFLLPSGLDVNEYKYNAIFGRINYALNARYLINITARRDGSSRFGPQSQFNNFGAIGAGWIMSEEQFLKNSFISFAKLRGSYGITGNDQIGDYRFMNLFEPYNPGNPYQRVIGLLPQGLPNPYLEWEENRKLQGGVDVGVWNDKLLLSINYYRNRSSNALTTVNMPSIAGFGSLITNLPALIQNTGWEMSFSSNINIQSVYLGTNINLTIPRNKLLAFPDLEKSSLNQFMIIGQPIGIDKTVPFYGVDVLTGRYVFANKHGEPTINPMQGVPTVLINTELRWYGGIQQTIGYKGFSLDFLVQATRKKSIDVMYFGSPGYLAAFSPSDVFGNQPVSVMKRWQKPGDLSTYQRFSSRPLAQNSGDLVYKDCSFVRIKNISVSYDVSDKLLHKIKLRRLRIYANAQNVFVFTPYRGLDPETLSTTSVPPLRMVTVGIQATL